MALHTSLITFLALLLFANGFFAQNTYHVIVLDAENREPLSGTTAIVLGTSLGGVADEAGAITIDRIPDGEYHIEFHSFGYESLVIDIQIPLSDAGTRELLLERTENEWEEVRVSATRSSRTISDIPTRVETIDSGELEEKTTMQPANAKMILTESTGIQTQQTSATSANASIRIQGLDGKYTQLLKDGFPLYAGFAGGLSIMQLPPLDLKRVEVIKGASSTLYGGGAIAGLINFVTKVPEEKKELSLLVNGNLSRASDISVYYAQKFAKIGITALASQNLQAAYDPNGDTLSDIPQITRYTFNPRLFYFVNPTTTLSLGMNTCFENRLGGDMQVINDRASTTHSYFEKNLSTRVSSQFKLEKSFTGHRVLTIKNSVGYFDRTIETPRTYFAGVQQSSYSEISYVWPVRRSEWIAGGNLWTDNFKQTNATDHPLDSRQQIAGFFIQNTFNANEKWIFESGFRFDAAQSHSFFPLPKLSVLCKVSPSFTTRLGGGMGYKTPTIFSEEADSKGFQSIHPIDYSQVRAEQSWGGNIDLNYRSKLWDACSFSINQLFYYTRLNQPLVLLDTLSASGLYAFQNSVGYLDTKGFETNVKFSFDEFGFYCGYTFIDAERHFATKTVNPLTARNRIYMTLTYELEGKLRIGYECFYTGTQTLTNGQTRRDYWVMGISAQYNFKHFIVFANAENFTDTRQTRFERIYTGTIDQPRFNEIWAPTDGILLNAGFKITFP